MRRWTKLDTHWLGANLQTFDPDQMTALFEADPSPALLDPALLAIGHQLAEMHLRISHQIWAVSDLREAARARISTQGHAAKPFKFQLVQIDENDVDQGDSWSRGAYHGPWSAETAESHG